MDKMSSKLYVQRKYIYICGDKRIKYDVKSAVKYVCKLQSSTTSKSYHRSKVNYDGDKMKDTKEIAKPRGNLSVMILNTVAILKRAVYEGSRLMT